MLLIVYLQLFEDGTNMNSDNNFELEKIGILGKKIETKPSYAEILALRQEIQWSSLENHVIADAIEAWLETLTPLTAKNYRSGMQELTKRGFVSGELSLQVFAMVNHEAVIDKIKTEAKDWTEATKQARAACYISFTSFLDRRLNGIIRKAKPNKEEANKTFYKIREKVKTQAMTYDQWQAWLEKLKKVNHRDCLIAKLTLQGAKRIQEVLTLEMQQINWNTNQITFRQSKTKGTIRDLIITYPANIMAELRQLIGNRDDLVFVTCNGKPVSIGQVTKTFEKAGIKASIPFKVTPHVLRTSAITYYKQKGCSDSEIQGVSGHASVDMLHAYDKNDLANNASKKVNLV
jgi:integrase/recombinase XerD